MLNRHCLMSPTFFSHLAMAVQLERADQNSSNGGPLPTVKVQNQPIQSPDYLEGVTTGRTQQVFTCDQQNRELVWKANYNRRQSQLSDGGFHGSLGHKYCEVGDVILDDRHLILQALGQSKKTANNVEKNDKAIEQHSSKCPPPVLRTRTPTQFPDQLIHLSNELYRSTDQLELVRKGHGLFFMMKQEEERKKMELESKDNVEDTLECQQATASADVNEVTADTHSSNHENEEEQISSEIKQAYRKLCVIQWILDCMNLESPNFMPALPTYWKIDKPSLGFGQRVYEKQQLLLKQWEQLQPTAPVEDANKKDSSNKMKSPSKLEKEVEEEKRLRKQKKLTPEQFEKLKVVVDEELNRSKKKARINIKELMKQSSRYQTAQVTVQSAKLPQATLDVVNTKNMFSSVDESRGMIVHEQLSVMSRDRHEALEQRFSSLQISGNMWKDIGNMRKGVEIESTAMAHNKLMMNYDWISELKSILPQSVFKDRYCMKILHHLSSLQDHMKTVGPKVMSQEKLILVLGSLYPWQLVSPDVSSAVEFIIRSIIYIVPEDYQKWLEYHTKRFSAV